jgi:gamma-glutamylcyclotransferase (GGCT)/AIG2-like uncharacterized protein YtfP
MAKRYYLAYGSNMNLEQMAFRCPTAKVIGNAVLEGYELLFRGGNGGAVATVEPNKNERVPVLVWTIEPGDEVSLDRYEGWPRLYRKEMVNITVGGKNLNVMVYIMNEGRPLGTPSDYYYKVIEQGYESAALCKDKLIAAYYKSSLASFHRIAKRRVAR